VVAADVKEVIEEGAKIGLSLNVDKCELITHKDTQVDDEILRSFKRVELEEATLLGAPLFNGSVLDSTWDDRCADLARACDRLSSLRAQNASCLFFGQYIILSGQGPQQGDPIGACFLATPATSSFSAPRVMHLLRCSPSTNHPALGKFESFHSANYELSLFRSTVDTGQPPSARWRSWNSTGGFVSTSCLFGFSRKHLVTPSRHFVFMYSFRL